MIEKVNQNFINELENKKLFLQNSSQDSISKLKTIEQMWNQMKPTFYIEMSQKDKEQLNLKKNALIQAINTTCQNYEQQMEELRQSYEGFLSILDLYPQTIQKLNEFLKYIDFQKSQIAGQYRNLENDIKSVQLI